MTRVLKFIQTKRKQERTSFHGYLPGIVNRTKPNLIVQFLFEGFGNSHCSEIVNIAVVNVLVSPHTINYKLGRSNTLQ